MAHSKALDIVCLSLVLLHLLEKNGPVNEVGTSVTLEMDSIFFRDKK